jgi:hypothetical protein
MTSNAISQMTQLLLLKGENQSVRENRLWGYKRTDNSLFAISSGLFVLQNLEKYFSEGEKILLRNLETEVLKLYPSYKNKDGKASYNFYPTQPSRHFGGGYFMQHFDHFRLPDDIDDTALVFLTDKNQDSNFSSLKELVLFHQHPTGVFNTWFGKNMPLEVDICANINMLILFYKNACLDDKIAKKVLDLLIISIENIEHKPFALSRHYGHPILILYHYARFMHLYPSTELEKHKSRLIEITEAILSNPKQEDFAILAEIALLKWGIKREKLIKKSNFYTFIGAPLAPILIENQLAFNTLFIIYWQSEFYKIALNLEYDLFFRNSL